MAYPDIISYLEGLSVEQAHTGFELHGDIVELVSREGEAVCLGAKHSRVVGPDEGLVRIPGGRWEPGVCAAEDGGRVGGDWGEKGIDAKCREGSGEACEVHSSF